MIELDRLNNPYGDDKVISACSIFGMMDQSGARFSGEAITKAIALMKNRSNGLGGGFAVYGLYPEFPDDYAFHIMYMDAEAKNSAEQLLRQYADILAEDIIPTRKTPGISEPPAVYRYFLRISDSVIDDENPEEDVILKIVMHVNTKIDNAFVFSSGKNMGVFKGVGYPEDISRFFRLEEYQGHLWTAHGRFPTNTQGWWGGAHPFGMLNWSVVHNGEISSYGINMRHLEMHGYKCSMHTDTEVVAYAIDMLHRLHKLSIDDIARVLAPPLWSEIDRMPEPQKRRVTMLRQVYGSLLLNGPFTIIIANGEYMVGLTDRIRLRPMVVGNHGSMLYLSSEESAIRLIDPEVEQVWIPHGGQPVIGHLQAVTGESRKIA